MDVEIRISGVSEEVCDRLKARAALESAEFPKRFATGFSKQSLQEFLRCELERIASRQQTEEWLERLRKLREMEPTRVSAEEIVQMLREDRE